MRWKLLVISLLVTALAGCATAPQPSGSAEWIEPSQAVQLAAASPQDGVVNTPQALPFESRDCRSCH